MLERLRGSDFSWVIGISVAAITYYLLGRGGVRQEIRTGLSGQP